MFIVCIMIILNDITEISVIWRFTDNSYANIILLIVCVI